MELERLHDLLGAELQGIAGATISGEIPLSETALNRLVADALRTTTAPIASLSVQPQADDTLTVRVLVRTGVTFPLVASLRIVRQPDMPHAPVVGIRWSMGGLGVIARLAVSALTHLRTMPHGIHLDGDRIDVNIRDAAGGRVPDEVWRHLTRLRIHTTEGKVLVRFELAVPERAETAN